MKLFDKIFKRQRAPDKMFFKIFNSPSDSITGKDATSFAAIDLICSSFSSLSGTFYDWNSRQPINEHQLYSVIRDPNIDETRFQFFYNSAKDYFSSGNVYWYKYDVEGELISLFRLNPSSVQVKRNDFNQKIFMYSGEEYTSDKIVHIPSRYGYNGLVGHSIFNECNRIFSNSSELDDYINNSFNNSIGKRLVIDINKYMQNPTDEQIEALKRLFISNYAGTRNAGVPLIKSGNIDYTTLDTGLDDNKSSQLVENRAFQEKEIAKLFGVPLPLLNGTETSNIESLYTIFIENAIRPLATQFEQAINKMIPFSERDLIYFEYSYNSLMKTSLQTRISTYVSQINNSILSPNEVRRKENLPEIEMGDTHFIAANLMPLRKDVIDAYLAKSKLAQEELENKSVQAPGVNGSHEKIGDDKI
jgi:HK97 family phage portal protein